MILRNWFEWAGYFSESKQFSTAQPVKSDSWTNVSTERIKNILCNKRSLIPVQMTQMVWFCFSELKPLGTAWIQIVQSDSQSNDSNEPNCERYFTRLVYLPHICSSHVCNVCLCVLMMLHTPHPCYQSSPDSLQPLTRHGTGPRRQDAKQSGPRWRDASRLCRWTNWHKRFTPSRKHRRESHRKYTDQSREETGNTYKHMNTFFHMIWIFQHTKPSWNSLILGGKRQH